MLKKFSIYFLVLFAAFIGLFLLSGSLNKVKALKLLYEAFISKDVEKTEFIGDFEGGQFGSALASGDFNYDGIQDLIVGAPFASLDDKEWNGAIRIIFGNSKGIDTYTYMDFYGENSGDQLGTSLAVGDFNNDFFEDIAVGAYNAQSNGIRPGKVYIIFGHTLSDNQMSSQKSVLEANIPYYRNINDQFVGSDSGDNFGLSLAALDINNDHIDDLLIGAPFAWSSYFYKSGVVYGYFGSNDGFPSTHNLKFYAQGQNERFGSMVGGGHITSTNTIDIIIGAYLSNNDDAKQAGKVYIYKAWSNSSYDRDPFFVLNGNVEKGWLGFTFDLGDINGDFYDDIAISSFPYNGNREDSKVSIFYGGKKLSRKADIVINQPEEETFIGASILLDDLNLDNKADIIVGAPSITQNKAIKEGSVYTIYSDNVPYNNRYSILNHDYDSIIHGDGLDDWFASAMAVSDFNNDGYKDLAVSARYADSVDAVNNGKVFVLWGNGKPNGMLKAILDQQDEKVTRAELIKIVLDRFDIRNKKADYIKNCYDYRDFCLFNFMAMSSFEDLRLEPEIILFPDVQPQNIYHEDINIATMLGWVNGYLNEPQSPFKPDLPITRIQALKIILGAADLVPPKYQFELIAILGSYKNLLSQITPFIDVDAKIPSAWWQPRYVNFAVDRNIIDKTEFFRPNDNITAAELDDLINRTLEYLKSVDEKVKP